MIRCLDQVQSKSQVDVALILQMEQEKCLEMTSCWNAQIEPILMQMQYFASKCHLVQMRHFATKCQSVRCESAPTKSGKRKIGEKERKPLSQSLWRVPDWCGSLWESKAVLVIQQILSSVAHASKRRTGAWEARLGQRSETARVNIA